MPKVTMSARVAFQQARDAIRTPDDGARLLALVLWGPAGEPPSWHARAACADTDPELWFNPPAGPEGRQARRRRIALCMGCPVRRLCADSQTAWETHSPVVRHHERHGYFGGQTGPKRHAAATATNQRSELTRSAS